MNMSNHRTADECKQDHIDALGKEFGQLYHHLWQELVWLYSKWNEYVELFGTKPSRIDLINKAAPAFFYIVQDSLWEDMILHIARLTDPPKSLRTKPNLTICKIPELINDENIKNQIEDLITDAMDKTDFCRDWRNRRIAHRDLQLVLKEGVKPLKSASRTKIKDALNSISLVLNSVSSHYFDSETMFDMKKGSIDGVVSLLYVIDDGLRAAKEREDRRHRGNYSKSDFQPRDL